MNKDLRSFVDECRKLGPDFYASVSRAVDPHYEPCVIQQKLAAMNRYPVLQFNRVNGSDMPLVTNLFGSYELLGLALGVGPDRPKGEILQTFRERVARPLPTREVSRDAAPVKQVIWRGDDIDLGRLPILKHAELNADKYITVGCLVVRDPVTGVLNAGMYRHQIKGRDRCAAMFNPAHHAGYIYRRFKELKRPMEAVLFIGHHPAAIIGALARGPLESDELEIMGALLGEPLEVVRCETVDLPVPAWAEIAIEGILDPAEETFDGPFSEYTGFYGPRKDPVGLMKVSAITLRDEPIYHDLDPSHREHNLAGVLTFESSVYDTVKKLVPSVSGVYMPASGSCVFTAYVRINKRVPGEGKSAGIAALAAEPNLKIAIVVDEEIDIYNEEQVLWAIATHFEADRDMAVISNAMGAHLNPSAYGEVRHEHGPMNTKIVIDATRPATLPFAERIHPPREAWERIHPEEYLDAG
jgi:2,5-furandicarboxylate decarboxylase 1